MSDRRVRMYVSLRRVVRGDVLGITHLSFCRDIHFSALLNATVCLWVAVYRISLLLVSSWVISKL